MKKPLHASPVSSGKCWIILILLAITTLSGTRAIAQPGSMILQEEFNGNSLGSNWLADPNWSAQGGSAYNLHDMGSLITSKKYDSDSYIIETTVKGFTGSYWRQFRFIFGQADPSDPKAYVLTYSPDTGGTLNLGWSTDNIYHPTTMLDEVSIYPRLEKDQPYRFKIARYKSGLIQIYLDKGTGYEKSPILEAIDKNYQKLGHLGWQVSTQTAGEIFYIDRIEARVPEVEKPAVREKQKEDDLITQVSASTGKLYKVSKLSKGSEIYVDRSFQITSVPSYLQGASFVQTVMDDKKETDKFELTTFLKKAAVVYVAYDPRGSVLPAWLNDWHKTGDVIGTTDPKMKSLQVYSKLVDYWQVYPRPFILGGNMASPAAGAQANYIVIAVERPVISNLEAENAVVKGAKIASDHAGYDGKGFVDFVNDKQDYIEWTTEIKVPGSYTLSFKFSNGSANTRSLALSADNVSVGTASFLPLSSWENWASYSGPKAFLKAGTHKIRLTATGQSGPNIDYLSLNYNSAYPETNNDMLARTGGPEFDVVSKAAEQQPLAYPNPFEYSTKISYDLKEKKQVSLTIYSLHGKKQAVLVDQMQEAGSYQTEFTANGLPGGIYLYQLQRGDVVSVGKVLKK
jgi:hypothetical protein